MRDAYKEYYNKKATLEAFIMATRRLGISSEKRKELAADAVKQTEVKDISDYDECKAYVARAEAQNITQLVKDRTVNQMRILWQWMNCSDPHTWIEATIDEAIKQHVEFGVDDRGRMGYTQKGKVRLLKSAFNTMFPNILPKGWYSAYVRDKGSLKDYFRFDEADAFLIALEATPQMSLEGWQALFSIQLNLGCREGSKGNTGILSLRWEDIDFSTKRCSLREKGGKGKAGRVWKNLPLDFFPWLHGWDALITWWVQCGKPTQGEAFPVEYEHYNTQFHVTRKKCNGRIAGDKETLKPHVLRKTHAQWCRKLKYPLEMICGQFPNGRTGVGWDNPKVLLDFYIDLEEDEFEEADNKARERMLKLGLVSPQTPSPLIVTESIQT
jgi:hypothetical protein